MLVNKFKIIKQNYIIALCVFIITLIISPYYVYQDQFHYIKIYNGLKDLDLINAYLYYINNIDSKEVVHFFFSWIGSNLSINKVIFFAFVNAYLAFIAIKLMRQLNASIYIISLIVLSNFYFYVFYFSAERLKFAVIFFILSALYKNKVYLYSLLSIFAHSQFIIIYSAILFKKFNTSFIRSINNKKISIRSLLVVFATLIILYTVYYFLYEHLVGKYLSYAVSNIGDSFFNLLKVSIFFLMTLAYSRKKQEVVFLYFVLFIATTIIGGERLNMFGYFIFLYYALQVNKGINFGVITTSIYFLFKTYGFVSNVFLYGMGFH
jgi:hypothetical protein